MKPEITEIQIMPIKPRDGLVGFASFVLNNWFYLGAIGIFTRPEGGYRLTYPTKGGFNIYHPISRWIAEEIEKEVTKKFEEVTNVYGGYSKVDFG